MKKPATLLWSATLVCMLGSSPTFAQPSGLRLDGGSEGFALRNTDNGLHLRFTSLPKSTVTNPGLAAVDDDHEVTARNTLRADLPVLSKGIHTSLGFSWDANKNSVFSSKTPAPTTFMGLGWNSTPSRSSGWSLSAEVGANFSGSNGCFGNIQSCNNPRPLSLTGEAGGNGLRLNPYVSFGATYSFDR